MFLNTIVPIRNLCIVGGELTSFAAVLAGRPKSLAKEPFVTAGVALARRQDGLLC